MEKEELIRNLGANITMCFLEGCPRADKCVKHLAYKMFGDQKTHGKTVMPSSLKADGQCDQFEEAIAKRYAKGAQHIFDEVRMKHFAEIKARVVRILGGRTSYYRCMRGEKHALLNSADMYFNDFFDTASPDDPEAMRLTTSDIYDYIRKRAGSRAVTESITVFGRYLSNVPDIQKVHIASGTAYYVKYRKNER